MDDEVDTVECLEEADKASATTRSSYTAGSVKEAKYSIFGGGMIALLSSDMYKGKAKA